MTDQPRTYLDPLHDELDRLRADNANLTAENNHLNTLLSTMDHFADVAETCERKANESHARREVAERALEQAEARVDQLTDQLALANDTLRHRATAVNATGATNDTLRAKVARVEKVLDRAEGARLDPSDYPVRVVRESDLRAALADQEPAK